MLLNAHHDEISFHFPALGSRTWRALIDTARDDDAQCDVAAIAAPEYPLQGRSFALFIDGNAPL
jgi:hypothetical protein